MSNRELVTFPGILKGNGREVACTVRATKISHPTEPNEFTHLDYAIVSAAAQLPDGQYDLLVHGQTIPLKQQHGLWMMR